MIAGGRQAITWAVELRATSDRSAQGGNLRRHGGVYDTVGGGTLDERYACGAHDDGLPVRCRA